MGDIATPITYQIVGFLKRAEHEDFYDRNTDFNPFLLQTTVAAMERNKSGQLSIAKDLAVQIAKKC